MRELQHGARHLVDGFVKVVQAGVIARHDDVPGQLPSGCFAQHGTVTLASQKQRVVTVDGVRE